MSRLTRRAFILILGTSALFPATVGAQTDLWSGVLDPSRAVTWRSAGAGPIPSRPTCQTVPPYTGTAARINTAIAGCPSGQAVELAAGTFILSDNIDISKNNVTLRGQGPLATKITWNADTGSTCGLDNGGAVCFNGGALGFGKCRGGDAGVCPDQTANWTAGYAKGATVITLDNVAGLAPGTQLFLDQLDDTADGWPLPGDIFVCAQGPGDPSPCTGEGGNTYGRDVSEGVGGRSQSQVVTVASVSGNQVTITPGLSMPNWRASQRPGAFWNTSGVLTGAGLENLTVDLVSNGGNAGRPGIVMLNVTRSWIRNVRIITMPQPTFSQFQGIQGVQTSLITVRDSYVYGASGTGPSIRYGIATALSSDWLVENNILDQQSGNIVHNGADTGSVFSHNFIRAIVDFPDAAIIDHDSGVAMVLYEGNDLAGGYVGDIIHGTHHFVTQFRNIVRGDGAATGEAAQWIQAFNRFNNLVGNVLGGPKFATYETLGLLAYSGVEIYNLNSKRVPSYPITDDSRVEATMLRWGNYDTVSGATRWNCAEVPTAITSFSNACPGADGRPSALPSSFYLSARPSWWATPWGTPPFPANGPDVTGGDVSGYAGHAYRIPARLCFENTAVDPAYPASSPRILLFDASVCYTAPSAPPAPSCEPPEHRPPDARSRSLHPWSRHSSSLIHETRECDEDDDDKDRHEERGRHEENDRHEEKGRHEVPRHDSRSHDRDD